MKKFVRPLIYYPFLFFGFIRYFLTGQNGILSHRAMVYFFCKTGGRFNDFLSQLISRFSRPLDLTNPVGLLGNMNSLHGERVLSELQMKGYVTFEKAVPSDLCDRLMEFALSTPAVVRPMDGEAKFPEPRLALYNPERPIAIRYDYKVSDLLNNFDVQSLLADQSLLYLAQKYLRARPRFDILSMWWHTNFHSQPDSEAAQFYHFDMDRLKWLKVFVYLTDVGAGDGPHSFISGTHLSGEIPENLLNKGYARLGDDEVFSNFEKNKEISFVAPKGTVIVEDTRGLHKGHPVNDNSRLILQLQLSNSLFGAVYPKNRFGSIKNSNLNEMISRFKDVYRAYL